MQRPGLRAFLERLVIDRDFLNAFRADLDAAIAPYDLAERQRTLLHQGAAGRQGVLAEAHGAAPAPAPADEPSPPASPAGAPPGPEIRLLVRLMFGVAGAGGVAAQLHYAAAMDALPPDVDPMTLPSPPLDSSLLPGQRLDDALFTLTVAPRLVRDDDGAFRVECLHATLPVGTPSPAAESNRHPPPSPVQALADAVRAAPRAGRRQALTALVAAIDTEGGHD